MAGERLRGYHIFPGKIRRRNIRRSDNPEQLRHGIRNTTGFLEAPVRGERAKIHAHRGFARTAESDDTFVSERNQLPGKRIRIFERSEPVLGRTVGELLRRLFENVDSGIRFRMTGKDSAPERTNEDNSEPIGIHRPADRLPNGVFGGILRSDHMLHGQ